MEKSLLILNQIFLTFFKISLWGPFGSVITRTGETHHDSTEIRLHRALLFRTSSDVVPIPGSDLISPQSGSSSARKEA